MYTVSHRVSQARVRGVLPGSHSLRIGHHQPPKKFLRLMIGHHLKKILPYPKSSVWNILLQLQSANVRPLVKYQEISRANKEARRTRDQILVGFLIKTGNHEACVAGMVREFSAIM
jgi:hypothetical protein